MRGKPGKLQRNAIALLHLYERGYPARRLIQSDGRAEHHGIRPGHKAHSISRFLDERCIGAVTEPDVENHLERHFTLEAFNDPNNVASPAHRHEVNDPDRAPVARELSFEDHRVVAIALAVFAYCHRWTQTPAPVLVVPDDRRKTGV